MCIYCPDSGIWVCGGEPCPPPSGGSRAAAEAGTTRTDLGRIIRSETGEECERKIYWTEVAENVTRLLIVDEDGSEKPITISGPFSFEAPEQCVEELELGKPGSAESAA